MLTIFKLHCGKLTLKIYSKGERVLRIEAVAHNTRELNCGRALDKLPEVVSRLKGVLERFADALSCIDQCFIADDMLEQLPTASRVSKTVVGGIDVNKPRIRLVIEALIALSPSPNGFSASDLAARVRALGNDRHAQYGPRHAAYDLKKLRGKHIVCRIAQTRRYEPLASGLRAVTALVVLRNKAIKPLLAAARPLHPDRGGHNPKAIDAHYHTLQLAMQGVFHELGIAA
jgi:DNA-binding transcriptional ArsR family regulator